MFHSHYWWRMLHESLSATRDKLRTSLRWDACGFIDSTRHSPTKVKPGRAGLVLGWVTAWEYPASRALFIHGAQSPLKIKVAYQHPMFLTTLIFCIALHRSTFECTTQCRTMRFKFQRWETMSDDTKFQLEKLDFVLCDASNEFASWSDFVPQRCEQGSCNSISTSVRKGTRQSCALAYSVSTS